LDTKTPTRGTSRYRHTNAHPQLIPDHRGKCIGRAPDFGDITRLRPFDALEEDVLFAIPMLVGVQNIPSVLEDPSRNPSNQTRLVRTVKQSDNRRSVHGVGRDCR
jgi:hypothetical protein